MEKELAQSDLTSKRKVPNTIQKYRFPQIWYFWPWWVKIPSKDFADVTLAIDISDGDGDGGHLQGGQSRRRLDFENLMFSSPLPYASTLPTSFL